ncbi:hypothetical protein [Streptomyces sp. NPDC097640]|uniref:hypothetical protein n=1 Tax=Streptomyces sp. NPDC097640 TaxID=3157229 RepID=UPI00332B3DF6
MLSPSLEEFLGHPEHDAGHSIPATLVQIAGFAVPMVFTIRYAAHVRAKAARPA